MSCSCVSCGTDIADDRDIREVCQDCLGKLEQPDPEPFQHCVMNDARMDDWYDLVNAVIKYGHPVRFYNAPDTMVASSKADLTEEELAKIAQEFWGQ